MSEPWAGRPDPSPRELRAGPLDSRLILNADPLDQCLDRWASFPEDLVLLRESSILRIETAEREWREAWGRHVAAADLHLGAIPADRRAGSSDVRTLSSEHLALAESFHELHGLVELVRKDGHGGNRQALGQYWRLLRDAMEIHLEDEAELPVPPRG